MSGERRVGLLGGAFDPIHCGHLAMAVCAKAQLDLDEVRFTPTGTPARRPGALRFSAPLRAELVALAIASRRGFVLWREELDREGVSYSADTIDALARDCPDAARWLIIGADQLAAFPQWHEPERIVEVCRLAVAPRAGVDRAEAEAAAKVIPGVEIDWLEMAEVEVSATEVRARLDSGLPIDGLVPPAVLGRLSSIPNASSLR